MLADILDNEKQRGMKEIKNKIGMKLSTIVIVAIILVLLVVALICACYFGIHRSKSTETSNHNATTENSDMAEIEQKDAEYFNKYLEVFSPRISVGYFIKNIETFTNEDITKYLYYYYTRNHTYIDETTGYVSIKEGVTTYTVSKEEMDEVVYKYFGTKDYEIVPFEIDAEDGIKEIADQTYQLYCGSNRPTAVSITNTNVEYDGNNVLVKWDFMNQGYYYGYMTFYLTINNGNYNVNKIEYVKN